MTKDEKYVNPGAIKALRYLCSYCHSQPCEDCGLLGFCQIIWSGEFEHLYRPIEEFLDD